MLDRKKYDEEIKKARENQLDELAKYLSEYIKLNGIIREMPVYSTVDKADLDEVKAIEIPQKGRNATEVADELVSKVFEKSLMLQHPRCFSFVTSAVSPYSLAGAILSDIYNVNTGGFQLAPTLEIIEEKLIKWMGSLAGYDEKCGGVFTSGGSLSNLTGMIAGRKKKLTENEYPIGCAYISDQAHSSIKKGLSLIGMRRENIKIIPSDSEYKMNTDLLEAEIKADIKNGKKPFLLIGTIGTTNTGSIDPLREMGKIKEKYGMWMHIDGAFGGSILFSEIYRNLAAGVETADSISWDTHKWAMQGYSCSCIIAKNKTDLINTYAEHPEYLADIIDAEHTDGWDLGIEMSRPARAIKLWYTVQAMGTDLLSDVIDYSFYNSIVAKRELEKDKSWEITSNPMCGTITFRYAPENIPAEKYDELNTKISQKIINDGVAYIVTTVIKGKRVLRLNLINGNTTSDDVVLTVGKLDEIAKEFSRNM